MPHATFVLTPDRDEPPAKPLTRSEADIHAWAMEQAELIWLGRSHELDIDGLAGEVQDAARRACDELESDLTRVIRHPLKWDHRPGRRGRGRAGAIEEHRRGVQRRLQEDPSLNRRLTGALEEACRRGRAEAPIETDLSESTIPDTNPCPWDEVMTRPIVWPEP